MRVVCRSTLQKLFPRIFRKKETGPLISGRKDSLTFVLMITLGNPSVSNNRLPHPNRLLNPWETWLFSQVRSGNSWKIIKIRYNKVLSLLVLSGKEKVQF